MIETYADGEQTRRASATLCTAAAAEPKAYDIDTLVTAHPQRFEGADMRDWYAERGIQYGPAFAGLVATNTAETDSSATVLAEVSLPGSIRSQQGAYDIHPALLDACFQAVGAHPDLHSDTTGTLMLPLECARCGCTPRPATPTTAT